MDIALLGATGRVGQQLIELLLENNHKVTALVRNVHRLPISHTNLKVIEGDAREEKVLDCLFQGQNAVISTLSTDGANVISESMPVIIKVMTRHSIERIITVGTAGILQSRTEPSLYRFQSSESKRKLTRAAEDHLKGFLTLKESNLLWTIVCPTYLPDGNITAHYRVEKNVLPLDGKKISTGDTAHFIYEELLNPRFPHCRVGISE
ncbi:NAD(P)H-binding protein [Bacillus sp. 1780r2a1]|uniref:NAD(P)-dependent oxidoreductase n=1 Tax=Priestia flexa TaxID=86664 RepID=UPI001C98E9E6|nr:NAD(P)H-binding protein [Priestia flexa]MBY6024282.1 NAD(P)H-binding protein [Nitratireductor sp. DP7N14-4]MDT2048221.1 NAD(P)H-binding protein [Priestia flexa]USY55694.1 NAD(P)H-binding protein [Bacillus sp. 1780r2a1]